MKLILTRHGETEENVKGIIQGQSDTSLSNIGLGQAKKVAFRLKDEKIDFIYSSDLKRAANTAKEIAKFHKNAPIKFVKELRERNFGELEGKKKSDLSSNWDDFIAKCFNPKNGETLKELYVRAEKFLHKILKHHGKDTVLLVGHNRIDKALITVIINKQYSEIEKIESLKHTSVNIFEIDEGKNHKIHLFNCVKHLE